MLHGNNGVASSKTEYKSLSMHSVDDCDGGITSQKTPLVASAEYDGGSIASSSTTSSNFALYKGLLFSCTSSLFFSICSVIVKYLHYFHPGQLACLRFVGIIIFTIPLLVYYGQSPFGVVEYRPLLICRGLLGATSLYLRFTAIHYMPIADASVIIFSVPVFVAVLARRFLKEPCGVFDVAMILSTITGIAFITKVPLLFRHDSVEWSSDFICGSVAALSSTVFGASVYIVLRKLKGVHHSVIMFYFGVVAIVETTVLTLIFGSFRLPHNKYDAMLLVGLGLFSFAGQWLLTRALQLEQAGPVSVVRAAADIVFVFVFQIVIFREVPDALSIAGAFLVTTCVIMTGVRKWYQNLPEHSAIRIKLGFFGT